MLTVEKLGDEIALAQRIELLREVRVDHLPAERDLLAGLALVARLGELHRRVEGRAVAALRLEVEALRRLLAFRKAPQQRLEVVGVVGRDHVENRHALDVLEVVEAEHLQIRLVRAHVHALVHVGDRVARGVEQRLAATLRLAQRRLDAAHAAAHRQRLELAAHDRLHVVRPVAQRQAARAVVERGDDPVLVEAAPGRDQCDVAPAAARRRRDLRQAEIGRAEVRDDQVRRLLLQRGFELGLVRGARGPHGDAAVTQDADDLLGLLDGVLDQEQLDDLVGLGHRELGFLGIRREERAAACPFVRGRVRVGLGRGSNGS